MFFTASEKLKCPATGICVVLLLGDNIVNQEQANMRSLSVSKQKNHGRDSDVFVANGNEWKSALVNVEVSGRANYILAKLRLLHPNSPKTKIAKDVLEKALEELDKLIVSY